MSDSTAGESLDEYFESDTASTWIQAFAESGQSGTSSLLQPDRPSILFTVTISVSSILLVSVFWLLAGLPGVLAAGGTVAIWYLLGSAYAIAAGVVLLGAVTEQSLTVFTLGTAVFLTLVLTATPVAPDPKQYVLSTGLPSVLFAGTVGVLWNDVPVWLLALIVIGGVGVVGYGLHRYQLLLLGLIDDGSDSSPDSEDQGE